MTMNKYIEYIVRKKLKSDDTTNCLEKLQQKKDKELQDYLSLIQKRLRLHERGT